MILFPLFLFVIIINLLWLTQFFVEIRSESTVVGLNVAMALSWLVFVFLYWNLRLKKSTLTVYDVLADTQNTTVTVDKVQVEQTQGTEMSEMKLSLNENVRVNQHATVKLNI